MKRLYFVGAFFLNVSLSALKVAVFCSADNKVPDVYKDAAFGLGKALAEKDHFLVTGGSNTGLMDAVGNGYVNHNGKFFVGIMPEALRSFKVEHSGLSEILWVSQMHERLQQFHEHSDVVVALPGGFGTLHELLDFLVHQQFKLIPSRRIVLLNLNGFWNGFIEQLKQMRKDNAITDNHLNMIDIAENVEACMALVDAPYDAQTHTLDARYWEEKK